MVEDGGLGEVQVVEGEGVDQLSPVSRALSGMSSSVAEV